MPRPAAWSPLLASTAPAPVAKGAVALLAVASLATAGTAAWAAWSVSGSTTTTAATATVQALTVAVAPLEALYPGAVRNVLVTVSNGNAFPVDVSAVRFSDLTTSDAGCTTSNLVLTDATGLTARVGAGATATLTLTAAAQLLSTAPDACQGKTFGLTATVTGASASS